jgi:putative heme-binding domain-containing protein
VRETPRDLSKRIETLRRALTPESLAQADLGRGQQLFRQHCATCHKFFGEGGNIGPDITGAQRTNIQYMLENIVDPSASVAKEFRMQMIQTEDGRVLTGLVESENAQTVTIVNANERIVLPANEVAQRKTSEVSVMPNGLLDQMDERAIRDLFGYLQR